MHADTQWITPDPDAAKLRIVVAHPRKGVANAPSSDVGDMFTPRWEAMCQALRATGAQLVESEPDDGQRRHVFTRDPAIQLGNTIVCGSFTHAHLSDQCYPGGKDAAEKRFRKEQDALIKALHAHSSHTPPPEVVRMRETLHGGNVVMDHHHQRIYLGFQPEDDGSVDATTQAKIRQLRDLTGYHVTPVAVFNTTDYYHLDTFFNIDEQTGQAYLYPRATDRRSFNALKSILGKRLNTISEDEALCLATNFINVGKYVVLTNDDPDFEARLAKHRAPDTIITPGKCDVPSFQIDTGGVRCATNFYNGKPDQRRANTIEDTGIGSIPPRSRNPSNVWRS